MITPTLDQKFQTVINKNTLFLVNKKFEYKVDKNIERLISETAKLQLELKKSGCNEKIIGDLIEKNNGLILLSTYTTLSLESLQGIITNIRLKDDEDYNTFFNKDERDIFFFLKSNKEIFRDISFCYFISFYH